MIGLDSSTSAVTASAASAFSTAWICPSGSPTISTPSAGTVESPVSVTSPTSEVMDFSLLLPSVESLAATNSNSTVVPGST